MRIEIETKYFPRLTAWHVRKALNWVNPRDLEGLDCICLMDYEPQDPDARLQPAFLNGFLYNGCYLRRKGNRPARVALYTRDLYFGIPKVLIPSPMAGLIIGSTLAHEIGHHVVAMGGRVPEPATRNKPLKSSPVNSKRERMADAYANEVVNRMLSTWYYKCGKLLARVLSKILFEIGNHLHWKGKIRQAAALEFRAYMLDAENYDAGQSYLQDRQMLLKTPQALNDAERLWIYHRRVASDQSSGNTFRRESARKLHKES